MARTTAANMARIIARMTDRVRRLRPFVYSWGMGLNVAEDDAAKYFTQEPKAYGPFDLYTIRLQSHKLFNITNP